MMRVSGQALELVTVSAASLQAALPNDDSGNQARWVLINKMDATDNTAHIRFGIDGTVVATAGDTPLPLNGVPLIISVQGYTNVAVIRSATANVSVRFTPLDRP